MSGPILRKEYYSIGEVCEITGLRPHVLRYWETQFEALRPAKGRSGNRVYREKDIKLILLVKHLLYEEKYTIEGARRRLRRLREEDGGEEAARRVVAPELLEELEHDLVELRELLAPPERPPGAGRAPGREGG